MKVVISSGHGKHVEGADGYMNEVEEARRTVEHIADCFNGEVDCVTFHDDTSYSVDENLETIVAFHNSQDRDVDVSVHFNCYERTSAPMGTECLFLTQDGLAEAVAYAISEAGDLICRGPKYRPDLYFLNNTDCPAILIEVCFVDSWTDTKMYYENFDAICEAIAKVLKDWGADKPTRPEHPPVHVWKGKCSTFGGPNDTGVKPEEGLAFFDEVSDAPHLFLPEQPPGTTGLARRLDPEASYVACRWNYDEHPKPMLASDQYVARVKALRTRREFLAHPADWGPHEDTGRVADISPGLMAALGIETDDEVEVTYPAPRPYSA